MPAIVCEQPVVIDGDSIQCRNLGQIRLLGVDAPDRRASRPCRGGYGDHVCDDRASAAAKATLRAGLRMGPVRVEQVGRDRYGRMLAMVSAGNRDMACWQLERGSVRYIVKYDNGRRVRRACGLR